MIVKVSELKPNMQVIYKINYPNGKSYIGFSADLKRRMQEHNTPSRNQACDKAIQKYGRITEIEILEFITDISQMEERERYWIAFYDTYKNKEKGYNLTPGGDGSQQLGEDSPKAKLTNEDVYNIRKRRFLKERKKDVYKDYESKISFTGFENIWLGKGYPTIGQEFLIEINSISRQEYSHIANDGLNNGRAKMTLEQIREIRSRYDTGEKLVDIHKDFPFVARNTISRIANRKVYKNVI